MTTQPTRTATVSLALALTATLTAAGCSAGSTATGSGGSASGGAKSTALTVGLVAEPANLDFTRTDGAAIPQALLGNVYDGLVKLDNDGKIVPDLATKWTVSPDRKTYTFDLTGDATFGECGSPSSTFRLRLRIADRSPRLPARRLARAAVMSASVGTELALLVDVGSS